MPFPLGSGHHERWYDATLGRIGFGQGTAPPPVVESLTATFTTASAPSRPPEVPMDGLPTSAPLPSSAHGIATTGASGAGAPDGGGPSWGGAYGGGFPSGGNGQAHVWEFVEAMARLFRDGDAWAASHCIIFATVSCATLRAVANAVAIRCALAAFALSVLLEHPPSSTLKRAGCRGAQGRWDRSAMPRRQSASAASQVVSARTG